MEIDKWKMINSMISDASKKVGFAMQRREIYGIYIWFNLIMINFFQSKSVIENIYNLNEEE